MKTGRGRWSRATSREERRSAQRRQILDAAARLASEHGADATLSDLARRAGIGRNSLYEIFADLPAVFAEVRAEALDAVGRSLVAAATTARTPVERLRALASAWIDVAGRDEALRALLRGGESAERAVLRRQLATALRAAIAEARSAGAVGAAPDPLRTSCLVGAFEAGAALVLDDPDVEPARLAETLVDLTLRAFR